MKNDFEKALECLKDGGVIIYPSESCYSFGCDAKNEIAVKKIHEIKNESINKPITLLVSDLKQIEEFGIINETAEKISEKLMPGKISLIIEKKDPEKYGYLSENGICFRIPDNKIAFDLCANFGGAITTTSVNIHKEPSMYKISEVIEKFGNKVSTIIETGDRDENIPVSTIYDTMENKIIRRGPVSEEIIMKILA